MQNERFLLFDLDGTLTDPGVGITNSVRYALEKFNIHPATREELFPYIGPPLIDSFQKYHGLSAKDAVRALAFYREYFTQAGIFQNILFDGIDDLLGKLQKEGYTLVIATSKPEEFTREILAHFHLTGYFDFIAGNTLSEERPTKASVIRYIREHYPSLNENNALMIGDRHHDVDGAKENGLPAVGVSYGYGSREELENAGAVAVADGIDALYRTIQTILPIK